MSRVSREVTLAALVAGALLLSLPTVPRAAEAPPLPSASNAVIHFDLERLRASDLYQTVEENIGVFADSNDKLQMFLEATGLKGAASTLKGFTIYSFSDPQHPQDFAGVLVSDFGAVTRARLEQAYAPVARSVGGRIVMPVLQTPDTEVVMSFLGDDRLTFGTARAVELVVGSGDDDPDLVTAMSRTATRRPIWGIINARDVVRSLMEDLAGPEGNGPMQVLEGNEALTSLTSVGFSVDLGTDVFFELRAFTDTAENARLLADAVKGMVALAQLGSGQTSDPDVVDFFRGVVAESERDSVYVSFAITGEQIERLKSGEKLLDDLIP